jgi:hypothetical protein
MVVWIHGGGFVSISPYTIPIDNLTSTNNDEVYGWSS